MINVLVPISVKNQLDFELLAATRLNVMFIYYVRRAVPEKLLTMNIICYFGACGVSYIIRLQCTQRVPRGLTILKWSDNGVYINHALQNSKASRSTLFVRYVFQWNRSADVREITQIWCFSIRNYCNYIIRLVSSA